MASTRGLRERGHPFCKKRRYIVALVSVLLASVHLKYQAATPPQSDVKGGPVHPNAGHSEEGPSSAVKSQTRRVFVDLGANCGNSYLQHRRDVMRDREEEWEVYLWEPSPQMHEFFLDDLAKENPNIRVLPYAAGVRNETLQLYVHRGQEHVKNKSDFRDGGKCNPSSPYNPSGGTSIFKDAKVAGQPVSIAAINFPEWLASLRLRPGDTFILKIDIEGAELEILEHMLEDENDVNLCLTDKIAMEFHKGIFQPATALYARHEAFESTFKARYKSKCGHDINFQRLSR